MENKTRSFFDACFEDDIQQVQEILKSGEVDINDEEPGGFTPLALATLNTQEEIVRSILRYPELKLDTRDFNGMTALHLAVEANSVSIVRMICEDERCKPSLVNMKDDHGSTALMTAVINGFVNIVKELDKVDGADFRTKDEFGRGLVEVTKEQMERMRIYGSVEEYDAVLKFLIERNKKVESLKVIAAYNVVKYVKNESDVEALEIPLILKHLVAGFLDNDQYMNDVEKAYSDIDDDLDNFDIDFDEYEDEDDEYTNQREYYSDFDADD